VSRASRSEDMPTDSGEAAGSACAAANVMLMRTKNNAAPLRRREVRIGDPSVDPRQPTVDGFSFFVPRPWSLNPTVGWTAHNAPRMSSAPRPYIRSADRRIMARKGDQQWPTRRPSTNARIRAVAATCRQARSIAAITAKKRRRSSSIATACTRTAVTAERKRREKGLPLFDRQPAKRV
jgi:hypothetical protein